MRYTFLLVGIAAAAAVFADGAHAQQVTRQVERRVIVTDPTVGEDVAVYRSGADRLPAEQDYRGRWRDDQGPRGDDSRYDNDRRFDGEWDCRRSDGVTGAAVGGVVGGVAGNRIAGRGDRVVGTVVGAGVGAVAGAAIDRASRDAECRRIERYRDDDRRDWSRDDRGRHHHGHRRGYDYGNGPYVYTSGGYDYGYRDGYGYQDGYRGGEIVGYAPGPVTTIIMPAQPITVEETVTTYETVRTQRRARVAPRRPVHRHVVRPRPRPRPACVCGS